MCVDLPVIDHMCTVYCIQLRGSRVCLSPHVTHHVRIKTDTIQGTVTSKLFPMHACMHALADIDRILDGWGGRRMDMA